MHLHPPFLVTLQHPRHKLVVIASVLPHSHALLHTSNDIRIEMAKETNSYRGGALISRVCVPRGPVLGGMEASDSSYQAHQEDRRACNQRTLKVDCAS